jgi:hypothetical protein
MPDRADRVRSWAEIGDKTSPCLHTSGIGYNDGVASTFQMAAGRTGYITGSCKPTFMTTLPPSPGIA